VQSELEAILNRITELKKKGERNENALSPQIRIVAAHFGRCPSIPLWMLKKKGDRERKIANPGHVAGIFYPLQADKGVKVRISGVWEPGS
jgi:hypothetical protein